MSTTMTTRTAYEHGLKEPLKARIGQAVSLVFRRRTDELIADPVSRPSGIRDKAIMAFLKEQAVANGNDSFFERLHQNFWRGQGGAVFAQNCDHRFEDLFLGKQRADFKQLKTVWKTCPRSNLVEFGCNSGLLLNYLTKNLPSIDSSIGIELNSDQVRRNQGATHFDRRIEFLVADGGDWLLKNGRRNTLFVTNGGVLEYFSRQRLDRMLTHVATHLRSATFFCIEPVAEDHDWSTAKESIPFGDELSFSHNYTDLFEHNGFRIVHQRDVRFESWKMVATIAIVE